MSLSKRNLIQFRVRKCLRCGKEFNSEGSCNRICFKCDKRNQTEYDRKIVNAPVFKKGVGD